MIPLITDDVCKSTMANVKRDGIESLVKLYTEWGEAQPFLVFFTETMVKNIIEQYGRETGEIVLRMCCLVYKLIDTQLEVNDLNERAEL